MLIKEDLKESLYVFSKSVIKGDVYRVFGVII